MSVRLLARYSLPFPGRSLCPAVVIERHPDPMVEIGPGGKSFNIDVDIAAVFPTFHEDGGAAFFLESRIMGFWVDSARDAPLAYGDAHLALDHESDAAKHFLFLDTAVLSYSHPYPIYQSFIRWHRGSLLGSSWR
jgi:hypothetical protein